MARIFDVVEYASEMPNEIVHHFPEEGVADLRFGSQVIVRESQRAIFFRDGKALDVLGAGRHTISTANLPLLTNLLGVAFNNRTPFTAEVYYVAMREFADRKWGTSSPIIVQNQGVGLGMTLLQGFGSYSFQVQDPQLFVTQVVGATKSFTLASIENRLKSMLLSKLQDTLATTAATQNIFQLISLTEELGTAVKAKAQEDFAALGLLLKTFYIANLKPSETSAEDLRNMGMLDMNTYTQLQAADAMRDAARNENGGAGLTAGIGAGMGIGGFMTQAFAPNMYAQQPTQQPVQQAAPTPAATPVSDVMTPSEVAQILKVSEEDVKAAIEAGDLKARKIGSAYRISKAAVDEFLQG